MQVYFDDEFRCHTQPGEGRVEVETDFFDGKCDEFIEGHCLVPEGAEIERNGMTYAGPLIFADVPYSALVDAQMQYAERIRDSQRETMDKAGELLTDEQAVTVKGLYREWRELIGKTVKAGYRFTHEGELYKTIQPEYAFVAHYVPGDGTESLFTRIDEAHSGTIYDPIPYEGNMVLVSGKYYSQGGVVYICTRDTINPVFAPLSELVHHYVEVVDNG